MGPGQWFGTGRSRSGTATLAAAVAGAAMGGCAAAGPAGQPHPRDSSLVPPPTIFVAQADNCQPSADPPAAAAGDVSRDGGAANRFVVQVPHVDAVAVAQASPTLCWAACTQTLLAQQNVPVDQVALGNHFVPDPDNQTAGVGVIVRALNLDLVPRLEQRGSVPIDLVGTTSDQVLAELLAGHLCLVGLLERPDDPMGHACVVCGATFARLNDGPLAALAGARELPDLSHDLATADDAARLQVDAIRSKMSPRYGLYEVDLFDPDRGGSHRKLSGDAFRRQAVFLTSHNLARQTVLAALGRSPSEPAPAPDASPAAPSATLASSSTAGSSTAGSSTAGAAGPEPSARVLLLSESQEDARLATLPARQRAALANAPTPAARRRLAFAQAQLNRQQSLQQQGQQPQRPRPPQPLPPPPRPQPQGKTNKKS